MRTLQQILIASNAYLDLEAAVPSGTDLPARSNYANEAVWDASAVAQFAEFHNIYEVYATIASIPLPTNFRELMGPVHQLKDNGEFDEFTEIRPLERFGKSSEDKYLYILGNPAAGYTAVFNGLTIGATLSFDYQRFPSGLLTLTDICELPDPQYVTSYVESYVLESRSDERFPTKRAEANSKLQNMVGREMKGPNNGGSSTPRRGAANYSIGG